MDLRASLRGRKRYRRSRRVLSGQGLRRARMSEAERLIDLLDLRPHPEGGHFRETFRDLTNAAGRSHGTAIYFLLKRGEPSRWHRIDAAEVWHWYAGAPLVLSVLEEGAVKPVDPILGTNLANGE